MAKFCAAIYSQLIWLVLFATAISKLATVMLANLAEDVWDKNSQTSLSEQLKKPKTLIEEYQMIEELLTTKKVHGHVCSAISFAVSHVRF